MQIKLKILLTVLLLIRLLTFSNTLQEGKRVQLSGRIQKEVLNYDYSQRIQVNNHTVYVDAYPVLSYGDFVTIEGKVIDGKIVDAKLIKNDPTSGIYKIRKKLITTIRETLPTKDAALVSGMILGSKELITNDFYTTLVNSGTIHVVVASGTNVTLTAGFIILLFTKFFSRKYAIGFALISIWVYVLLSGFDAPLVRAAIMGSIAYIAQGLGRVNYAIDALFASVILMLIFSPQWASDIGFYLSFFATLSLIVFERYLYNKLSFVPLILRQDLSTSLSAQIGVTPLLINYFGRISLLGPLANMLVLWTVPFVMVIGSVSLFVSLFIPIIGEHLLLATLPFTRSFIFVVELLG